MGGASPEPFLNFRDAVKLLIRLHQLGPRRPDTVAMGFDEAGQKRFSLQIHELGARAHQRPDFSCGTDGTDSPVLDRQRFDDSFTRIKCDDAAVDIDGIGGRPGVPRPRRPD